MASSLGTLTLDLIARIGGFTAPLDKAEVAARKSGKGIAAAANEASFAWSALAELAAGAVAAFSVASIFGRFVSETRDAENEQAQLGAVLRSTGESAGYNRDQLNEMAGALEKASTFSGGNINQAQTALLAFTGIVGNEFNRALQSAIDMAARTGVAVKDAAEMVGRALDVPSQGLTALSKQGFRFTEDQKKLVAALESTGDVAGAQGIILKALEETYSGAAAAARDTFGGSLESLQNTISGLLTGEGSLETAKAAVFALNDALASPMAKTGIETLAKAAAALAVVLAVRVTGAAAATAASFVVGQVEAVKYQLALARMAGVSEVAAVGLVSVGAAARAASAAMALLGGPVGVILLAASALTYFVTRASEADKASSDLDERIGKLDASFLSLSANQAAAAIPDYTNKLDQAAMAAAAVAARVFTLNDNIKRFPGSPSQEKWQADLVQAKGDLDTATQAVDGFKSKIEELNGVISKSNVASVATAASSAFTKMAADIDERILLVDKKTEADKLSARINAGLIEGLKAGEGDLLLAKLKTLKAGEDAVEADKKRLAAIKEAATSAKSASDALEKRGKDAEESYQRQIELINTTTDKRNKATEVAKLGFEIESGKLVGINTQQQERLKGLAAELDVQLKLKQANEDAAKLSAFGAGLTDTNQTVKRGFEIELAGSGSGDKLKERLRADLAIQQDHNKQVSDLTKQFQGGDISQEIYDQETEMLGEALVERMVLQQDYYNQLDEAQNNWMDGVSSAWENYKDTATDYQQQAADATASILGNATSGTQEFLDSILRQTESLGDAFTNLAMSMVNSIVGALEQMAAQWLVYQAVQLMTGKATQASGAMAMIANAQATAFQASLAAFASTAAIPLVGPILAPGAAAAAALATGPMVAGVASAALSGMAHDGIDSVPQTGTWLLQKGERVTTAETSEKLDRTLEKVSQGAAGGSMNVEVHNYSNSQVRTKRDDKGQLQVFIEAVREDFMSGVSSGDSAYSRAIEGTYHGMRRGA